LAYVAVVATTTNEARSPSPETVPVPQEPAPPDPRLLPLQPIAASIMVANSIARATRPPLPIGTR